MGKDRNINLSLKQKDHYSDPEVCKNFLVAICYNDLFPNTEYDEGLCPKRHDKLFKI